MKKSEIEECVNVTRTSFATVAKEFNITKENCPIHTSFADKKIRKDEGQK